MNFSDWLLQGTINISAWHLPLRRHTEGAVA
jgi:hypothetical protein